METFNMKKIVICTAFRTVIVQIGDRKYDVNRISEASYRRLQTVLESVSREYRWVELDPDDLSPTAHLWYGRKHTAK